MTSPMPPRTFIRELKFENFRKFERLQVQFDPYLNVIVAENSGGKSTILDAVALAFRLFVDTLAGEAQSHGISVSDVRSLLAPDGTMLPTPPTSLDATAEIDGQIRVWRRERVSVAKHAKTLHKDAAELKIAAEEIQLLLRRYATGVSKESPVLPILAYHGTARLHDQLKVVKRKVPEGFGERTSAYIDALSSSSSWSIFTEWFRRLSYEAKGEADSPAPSPHRPEQMLQCIREATDHVLIPSGWRGLAWDFLNDTLVASHQSGVRLPVDSLSGGIQMALVLAADIAQRAARLNPQFGNEAARKAPGIVLVDEVETSLHPKWQQRILPSLRDAFPNIQWIVTTHSECVLTTVPAASIRVLDSEGNVYIPGTRPKGILPTTSWRTFSPSTPCRPKKMPRGSLVIGA